MSMDIINLIPSLIIVSGLCLSLTIMTVHALSNP